MNRSQRCFTFLLMVPFSLFLNSCTSTITTNLLGPALENMQQQTDITLVCQGTPPYLLMIDSLIASDPQETDMLILGAKAYGGYIGAMQECGLPPHRISAMADKAHLYGTRLLDQFLPTSPSSSLEEFEKKLNHISKSDAAALFWGSFGWIRWIEQQKGAPAALADLTRIEKILLKVVELDETIQSGTAHFLLGAYYGSRPQMLGGKPEVSKFHFDRALEISERKMLTFQTVYAQTLARLTMDKELHDTLLTEVINFDTESNPDNMLTNLIAQKKAKRLLEEDFF